MVRDLNMRNAEYTQSQLPRISVVIPTLGGDCLYGTIDQLNRGTIVPSEILVCIPEEDAYRVAHLTFPNVRLVKTSFRGQVAQRVAGFQQAQHPIVMQLDDDIFLEKDCLEKLANALCFLGQGNALGPVYFDVDTGRCIHELADGIGGLLRSLYYYIFCGSPWGLKRMGTVTGVGLSFGVDSDQCDEKPFETQWLPGGCALCFKEDLIMEKFFPYPGKAYGEDLIHSFLRTKCGLRHWVIPGAICSIDAPRSELSPISISAQVKARRYFVKLSAGSAWRLSLYEALSKVKRALSRKG